MLPTPSRSASPRRHAVSHPTTVFQQAQPASAATTLGAPRPRDGVPAVGAGIVHELGTDVHLPTAFRIRARERSGMRACSGARASGGKEGTGGRSWTQSERPRMYVGVHVADRKARQSSRGELAVPSGIAISCGPAAAQPCAKFLERARHLCVIRRSPWTIALDRRMVSLDRASGTRPPQYEPL